MQLELALPSSSSLARSLPFSLSLSLSHSLFLSLSSVSFFSSSPQTFPAFPQDRVTFHDFVRLRHVRSQTSQQAVRAELKKLANGVSRRLKEILRLDPDAGLNTLVRVSNAFTNPQVLHHQPR